MRVLRAALRSIDRLSIGSGKVAALALIALIIVVNLGVFTRRILHNPISWNFDVSYMLWGFLFVVAAAWTQLRDEHVRIDILVNRLPPKTALVLDEVLYIAVCLPTLTILTWKGVEFAWSSWKLRETIPSPPYLPLYPLKATVPVGMSLLLLQAVAKVIRNLATLLGKEL